MTKALASVAVALAPVAVPGSMVNGRGAGGASRAYSPPCAGGR